CELRRLIPRAKLLAGFEGTGDTVSSMSFDRVTVVCVGDRTTLARGALATQSDIDVVCAPVELAAATIREARVGGGVVAIAETAGPVVKRARTRAVARLDGPVGVTLGDASHDGGGLALLAGAMVGNLSSRLEGALFAC